jgi:hypothetical protein
MTTSFVEPREQVADRVQVEVLELRVAARLVGHLGDVELVVDVAVQAEPFLVHGRDRLPRQVDRDRHVPEPAAARRLGDDGALVADDRVVEARLERVRADRPEHPAGDEDDVDSRRTGGGDRAPGARVQEGVFADEGAVEVARERVDRAGEGGRESQLPLVRNVTRALICGSCNDAKLGITFAGNPGWTYAFGFTIDSRTNLSSGCFAVLA